MPRIYPAQPGFQISMRYAPHLTAFEVWVWFDDKDGGRSVLASGQHPQTGEDIPGSVWVAYKIGTNAEPSFLIAPEETYELAQELHRYGPFKPDKPEPDTEQIEWLRSMIERVVPTHAA